MTPEEVKAEEKQWKEIGYSFFKDIEVHPIMGNYSPDENTKRINAIVDKSGVGVAFDGNDIYLGSVREFGDQKIFIYKDCHLGGNFDDRYRIIRECFAACVANLGREAIVKNITHMKKPKDPQSYEEVHKKPFCNSFTFNFTKTIMEEPMEEGPF